MTELKCIDFKEISGISDFETNEEAWTKTSNEVVLSLEELGFMYIKNHGISQHLIKNMHEVCRRFFELPLEVKQSYKKLGIVDNGYVAMSREMFESGKYSQELRESFDITEKEESFPSEVEEFQEVTVNLIEEGSILFKKLLRCIEIGLDIPRGSLVNEHKNLCSNSNKSALRLINYPPVPDFVPEGSVRCGEHSDYGTITMLFQDSMGGLEVKNKKGKWIKADPIPDTILVNVGDVLQMMTSNRLIATKHRVLIPEEEIRRKCSRKSVVFFLNPDLDTVVKPLDGSPSVTSLTAGEYLFKRLMETYQY